MTLEHRLNWLATEFLSVTFYLNRPRWDSSDNKQQQFALSDVISFYFLFSSSPVFLPLTQAFMHMHVRAHAHFFKLFLPLP